MSHFCTKHFFTAWTEELEDEIMEEIIKEISSETVYYVIGRHLGEKSGKPHYHGWLQFKEATLGTECTSYLNTLFKVSTRTFKALGDYWAAHKYCSKNNKIWHSEEEPRKRKLPISKRVLALIEDGALPDDLRTNEDEDVRLYYFNNHKKCNDAITERSVATKRVYHPKKVYYYYGNSRTGKTKSAVGFSDDHYFKVGFKDPWFPFYRRETTLIIDEFFYDKVCDHALLRVILDDYTPTSLPYKGGFVSAEFDTVILTSNEPPPYLDEPFMKRIEVKHFT